MGSHSQGPNCRSFDCLITQWTCWMNLHLPEIIVLNKDIVWEMGCVKSLGKLSINTEALIRRLVLAENRNEKSGSKKVHLTRRESWTPNERGRVSYEVTEWEIKTEGCDWTMWPGGGMTERLDQSLDCLRKLFQANLLSSDDWCRACWKCNTAQADSIWRQGTWNVRQLIQFDLFPAVGEDFTLSPPVNHVWVNPAGSSWLNEIREWLLHAAVETMWIIRQSWSAAVREEKETPTVQLIIVK